MFGFIQTYLYQDPFSFCWLLVAVIPSSPSVELFYVWCLLLYVLLPWVIAWAEWIVQGGAQNPHSVL
jgi:hypothetical protein